MHSLTASLFLAAAFALPLAAHADVLGPFTVSGPGTTSTTSNADGSDTLAYYLQSTAVYGGVSWTFAATAATTEDVTFTYSNAAYSGYYEASATLEMFDANGDTTLFDSGTSGPFTEAGTATFDLVAGQEYGFIATSRNDDSDDRAIGTITVTPTAEVAATPEPSSLVLLGTGMLGMAGAARRRFFGKR